MIYYWLKCAFLSNFGLLGVNFALFGGFDPAPCLFVGLKYTNLCFSSDFFGL